MSDRTEHLPRGTHRGRIEWIDTDAAGIYHNSTVTRFVEAAEAGLMRSRGLDDYFPQAPRARFEVVFSAPLYFGQELTATVVLERIGTASMTFSFEVWGETFKGRPRRLAASGRYVTVHIDGSHASEEPARSSPWPPAWIHALQTQSAGQHGDEGHA